MDARCHGDSLGDRHIAVRREQAAADAVHKAEFIRRLHLRSVPFGIRNIREGAVSISGRFVETGRKAVEGESKCGKQADKNPFFHALAPFLFLMMGVLCGQAYTHPFHKYYKTDFTVRQ